MKHYLITQANTKGLTEGEFYNQIRSLQLFTREEELQMIAEYALKKAK